MMRITLRQQQPLPAFGALDGTYGHDLLDQGMDRLLRNQGIPAEVFRGTTPSPAAAHLRVLDAQIISMQTMLTRICGILQVPLYDENHPTPR